MQKGRWRGLGERERREEGIEGEWRSARREMEKGKGKGRGEGWGG